MQSSSSKQSSHATKCPENFVGKKIICFNNNWMKNSLNTHTYIYVRCTRNRWTFLESVLFLKSSIYVTESDKKGSWTKDRRQIRFFFALSLFPFCCRYFSKNFTKLNISWNLCLFALSLALTTGHSCVLWKHFVYVMFHLELLLGITHTHTCKQLQVREKNRSIASKCNTQNGIHLERFTIACSFSCSFAYILIYVCLCMFVLQNVLNE